MNCLTSISHPEERACARLEGCRPVWDLMVLLTTPAGRANARPMTVSASSSDAAPFFFAPFATASLRLGLLGYPRLLTMRVLAHSGFPARSSPTKSPKKNPPPGFPEGGSCFVRTLDDRPYLWNIGAFGGSSGAQRR